MTTQTARRRMGGILWGCAAIWALALLFSGCGAPLPDDLLDRITGNWVTEAEDWEGAQLEISRRNVTFHTINGTIKIYRVADIRHEVDKKGDLVIIDYRNEYNQKYLLSFYLIPTPAGDTLVKKNLQHIIWKKAKGQ